MRILVTGCNGQLGTEIVKCFERGYTELGIPNVLKQKNVVTAVDIDKLDICNLSAVVSLFEEKKIDVVINCAAYTNVDKCETEQLAAFSVNAVGVRNLAMASQKIGAKLVHVSTDYVFEGNGTKPLCEWERKNPISAYGKSKALGEEYVSQFCSKYFIVRTAWLYGYNGKNFVKTIMRVAKEKGKVTVVNDQLGNPTNAADLAHHILKLLTTEEYGIYHGTANGECSWCDFASEIVKLAGIDAVVFPCTSDEYPSPTKRPAYSSLDNMMFRVTVGDEFRPWQDALKCFFENYKG